MSLTFSQPWGTAGIVCGAMVLLMLIWAMGVTRGRSRRWRGVALMLPGIAGLAIAGALMRPMIAYSRSAGNIVILLDLSGSTRASPWRDPRWVRALARRRLDPGTTLSVVSFAATPQLLMDHVFPSDDARWPTAWPAVDPDNASDIARALAWRSPEEARNAEPLAPRWLLTDGLAALPVQNWTMPLAVTEIPPASDQPDLGIIRLQRVASGELAIQIRATGPASGRLTVERDGQPFASQELIFSQLGGAGSTRWVTLHDADGDAPHRYEVTIVRTPTPDPWPENDRASLQWSPPSAPRVLIVNDGKEEIRHALDMLHWSIVPSAAFPSDLRSLLAANQQVVVLDSAAMLSPQQLSTLDAFVRETGGGLLLMDASGLDEDSTVLAALSPVFNSSPNRTPARIVFLLDASGSMNETAGPTMPDQKFRLAAHGVIGAIERLHADDQLTVLTFNDAVHRLAAGTKQELAATLEERLAHVQPTGPTSPDAALPEIASAFANKPPDAPALVILLTDGQIPSIDAARWEATLHAAGASLTLIAPHASPADALSALATTLHAHWYPTEDATRWPLLLRRAVSDAFAGREQTTPLDWHSENFDGPVLQGKIARWREVWRKPEALPLARADDTTLAAIAQRGLGRVAAVAMNDLSPSGTALLQRIVQKLAPPAGDRRVTLSGTRSGEHWLLTADALDDGQFMNELDLHATVINAEATTNVGFHLTAPGHYEAGVESPHPFQAIVAEGDHLVGTLPIAQVEISEWPASVEVEDEMKIPAGVMILDPNESADKWAPHVQRTPVALAPVFWGMGILLLLLSLLVKRSG
jgi:Mg-chelatase subunit ChlD